MGTGLEIAALAIAASSAAAGGYATYSAAEAQNTAARRSAIAANKAATVRQAQLDDAAELEQQKRKNEAEQIRGRLRVSGAAADVGLGGSYAALAEQANVDEAINLQTIQKNRANQGALVQSGLEADLLTLQSHMTNPILQGFTGSLQGAQTGLSIAGAVNSFGVPTTSTPPPPAQSIGVNVYGSGARGSG